MEELTELESVERINALLSFNIAITQLISCYFAYYQTEGIKDNVDIVWILSDMKEKLMEGQSIAEELEKICMERQGRVHYDKRKTEL